MMPYAVVTDFDYFGDFLVNGSDRSLGNMVVMECDIV